MLSSETIDSKEFSKSFRGYSEDEVDIFLAEVKENYEALVKENESLKEKLLMYKDQLNKYSSIEETLKETLITAQSAAEDTTNAANKKARVIVQESELKSKQIIDKANNKVVEIKNQYDSLLKEFKIFRNKFKSLLEDEIINIDEIFSDVDYSYEFNRVDNYSNYDKSGTMRMDLFEEVQNDQDNYEENHEEDNGSIDRVNLDKKNSSPEDIFDIK